MIKNITAILINLICYDTFVPPFEKRLKNPPHLRYASAYRLMMRFSMIFINKYKMRSICIIQTLRTYLLFFYLFLKKDSKLLITFLVRNISASFDSINTYLVAGPSPSFFIKLSSFSFFKIFLN